MRAFTHAQEIQYIDYVGKRSRDYMFVCCKCEYKFMTPVSEELARHQRVKHYTAVHSILVGNVLQDDLDARIDAGPPPHEPMSNFKKWWQTNAALFFFTAIILGIIGILLEATWVTPVVVILGIVGWIFTFMEGR